MRLVILIVLSSILTGCLSDPAIKIEFESYAPEPLNDGWDISTPDAEGFDVQKIDAVYQNLFDEDIYPTARSLLIIRNGKLVAEAYCKDKSDRETFHALQSATKSITSMVMGIAVDQGLVDSVHMPVYTFIPEYFDNDPKKRLITVYHALTMQTGLAFVNDDHTNELFNTSGSTLEYVLSKGMRFDPGTSFYYNDGDPQLVSGVIQKVAGVPMKEFARQFLFEPMGIQNYLWETHADGVTFGAVALWLTPRDMARIGKLMAQKGVWEGARILSEEWIAESTSIHTNTNYGFYWWNYNWENAFMAVGRGEQLIFVEPHEHTVIVLTTDSFSDELLSPGIRDLLSDVMAAIIN